ncbi:MAG: hypothetical protein M3406_12895 [Chloroflexota bacterium]|nr:hypothetical protein [Chloroflexota bacterium]
MAGGERLRDSARTALSTFQYGSPASERRHKVPDVVPEPLHEPPHLLGLQGASFLTAVSLPVWRPITPRLSTSTR